VWWAGDRLDAFLGMRRVVLARGEAIVGDAGTVGFEEGLECLVRWLDSGRRRPLMRLWLSGQLCRPFMLRDAGALRSAAELDAASEALARQAFDDQPVRWWLQEPHRARPCLGAAVASSTVHTCESVLQPKLRARLRVSPWWAEASRLPLESCCGWVVQDCDSLTLLAVDGDRIVDVRTASPIGAEAATTTLRRWRSAGDLPAGEWIRLRLRADVEGIPGARKLPLAALTEVTR
jgi:hypothetical protein